MSFKEQKVFFGEDAKIIEEIESYTNMIMKSFFSSSGK